MITYEMLSIDEWQDIKPLYEKLFPEVPFPTPEASSVAVAKDGDRIIAFWFLQLCAHAEPVGIDENYRDIVSLHSLQSALLNGFKHASGMEYYIAAPNVQIGDMLKSNGFKLVGLMYSNKIP